MRHMRENVTTATLITGDEDGPKSKSATTSIKSVPVIATETRKVAYTETKVNVTYCNF